MHETCTTCLLLIPAPTCRHYGSRNVQPNSFLFHGCSFLELDGMRTMAKCHFLEARRSLCTVGHRLLVGWSHGVWGDLPSRNWHLGGDLLASGPGGRFILSGVRSTPQATGPGGASPSQVFIRPARGVNSESAHEWRPALCIFVPHCDLISL